MAIVFPTAAAAAGQTPVNTFSPNSSPLQNTVNNITYVYDTGRGVWTAAGAGSIAPATLAEAATGTLNTVYSSPLTSVPKDASGMTGAALMPGGTNAQRAAIATPVGGMLRYNTDLSPDSMEFYDATQSAWVALATLPQLQGVALDSYSNFSAGTGGGVFTDTPVAPASTVRNSIVIPAGYTNFIIYSSVAFKSDYNTFGGGTAGFNMISQNSTTSTPGTSLAYQAVVDTGASNVQGIQISANVFTSATSLPTVSNTFYQVINKNFPNGPLVPLDSSIVVLAWTI